MEDGRHEPRKNSKEHEETHANWELVGSVIGRIIPTIFSLELSILISSHLFDLTSITNKQIFHALLISLLISNSTPMKMITSQNSIKVAVVGAKSVGKSGKNQRIFHIVLLLVTNSVVT